MVEDERKTFYERLIESNKQPKEKINITVNQRDLIELKILLAKLFPDMNLSQAFNEMLIEALAELREINNKPSTLPVLPKLKK